MRVVRPHPVRVKICGINSPEAFDAAADAGADWVGFVFFPPSPRFVTPAQAAALSSRRDGGPLRVGLFVEPTDDAVAAALDAVGLDVLQLYASPERVRALRDRFGVPVWRAIGVAVPAELPTSLDGADGLVIEAKPPAGATRPGGNAVALDWAITAGWDAPGPWLLAGGLTADNVTEAIRVSRAAAVDVSSGVERTAGAKDPREIRYFLWEAKPGKPARPCELRAYTADLGRWQSPQEFTLYLQAMIDDHGSHLITQPGSPFRDAFIAERCATLTGADRVCLGSNPPDFELRFGDEDKRFEVVEILKDGRRRDSELKAQQAEPARVRYGLRHYPEYQWERPEATLATISRVVGVKAEKGYEQGTILVLYLNIGFYEEEPIEIAMHSVLTKAAKSAFPEVWIYSSNNKLTCFPMSRANQ